MVFMILHKQYTAFAQVRLARIPQELGHLGELRLTKSGNILHRVYMPKSEQQATSYLDIPVQLVDLGATQMDCCELCIVTQYGYQYLFRFSSDADALVFGRILDELEHLGEGFSGAELRDYRHRLSVGSNDMADVRHQQEHDRWLEPWTVDDFCDENHYWPDCRCYEVGHQRYAYSSQDTN